MTAGALRGGFPARAAVWATRGQALDIPALAPGMTAARGTGYQGQAPRVPHGQQGPGPARPTAPPEQLLRIAAVADFNKDGHPDVVWQNPVTGVSQVWFLSGAQGVTQIGVAALSGGTHSRYSCAAGNWKRWPRSGGAGYASSRSMTRGAFVLSPDLRGKHERDHKRDGDCWRYGRRPPLEGAHVRRGRSGILRMKNAFAIYDYRRLATDASGAPGLFEPGNCPLAEPDALLLRDRCQDGQDGILEDAARVEVLLGVATVADPLGGQALEVVERLEHPLATETV